MNLKREPKREQRRLSLLVPELTEEEKALRPRRRGDCVDGIRPCPFVSCRYHLYLDVKPGDSSITLNFPDLEVEQLPETCALDVAENGGETLEVCGELLNVTRERIRQLEAKAFLKIQRVDRRAKHVLESFADEGKRNATRRF